MPPAPPEPDLLLACDARGRILAVAGTDRQLVDRLAPGDSLADLVSDGESVAHALDLLLTLRLDGAAFGTRLSLTGDTGDAPRNLRFAGAHDENGTLIVAAGDRDRLAQQCRCLAEGAIELAAPLPGDAALAHLAELSTGGSGADRPEVATGRRPIAFARLARRLARRLRELELPPEAQEIATAIERRANEALDEKDR